MHPKTSQENRTGAEPRSCAGDRQQTMLSVIVCRHFPETPWRHLVLPTVLGCLQVGTSHSSSALFVSSQMDPTLHEEEGKRKANELRISKANCFLSVKGLLRIALTRFLQCKGGADVWIRAIYAHSKNFTILQLDGHLHRKYVSAA